MTTPAWLTGRRRQRAVTLAAVIAGAGLVGVGASVTATASDLDTASTSVATASTSPVATTTDAAATSTATATGTTSEAATTAATAAATASASASASSTTAATTATVDPKSRASVNKAWYASFKPGRTTSTGWTGSVTGCKAGTISTKARTATLKSVNFARALAGLKPVTFSTAYSAKAQKAALMMTANDALDHSPPSSWTCYTKAGAAGASHSNLALAWPTLKAGAAIEMYLDDDDSSNTAVGHRRWVLYPYAKTFGVGATSNANALYVLGATAPKRTVPAWVPWPTAGYFPKPLEPNGRWSLSASSDAVSFSKAKVKVTSPSGASLKVKLLSVAVGYGSPTLAWDLPNITKTGTYTVKVTGIRKSGSSKSYTHSYTVKLFTPKK